MTTSKILTPLSPKLKLILAYLYLGLAGTVVGALSFAFAPDNLTETPHLTPTIRIATIITSVITGALFAWVIYLIHQRKRTASLAFVIANLVSYALTPLTDISTSITAFSVVLTIIFLSIDIVITIFLLQSKEAAAQLKQK